MATNTNAVGLFPASTSQTPTAPLIEGAAAASYITNSVPRFDTLTALVGRYGMRVSYPSPLDFTGYDFIGLQHFCSTYSPAQGMDTIANGGLRIIFVDGAGAYAGFNVYGGNIPNYNPDKVDGYLAGNSYTQAIFYISKLRTPDISSGAINWSNIVAIESSTKTITASRKDMSIYKPVKRNAPSMTGTETLTSFSTGIAQPLASNIYDAALLTVLPHYQQSAAQTVFSARIGLTIGNGVTATNLTDSNFAIGFENPHEFSPAFRSTGPWILHGPAHVRAFKVIQSASDVLSLTDGSIASAGWWQWELSGSGSAVMTRLQFWRADGFRAAHGVYTDCIWNDCSSAVEVTAATVITSGVIRGAKTTALKVLSGAGVYSGLDLEINSPAAAYDIELGAGGAGTYELAKITVPAGYTLRLRNNSASNAITVKLPLGLAYSTSSAGGAITATIPEVSVDISVPALIAGSRVQLYSVTDGAEILNMVLASAGLTHTVLYTGNKVIRLRADHADKLILKALGVLTPAGLTFLDIQEEDTVYQKNAIDGSAVTGLMADGPNIQLDINEPDGILSVQEIYAWLQWYTTTEEGIASDFFGQSYAVDTVNYVFENILLDNVGQNPVKIVDGYLYRKDGITPIVYGSNSIYMASGKSYAIETGVSGLTPTESSLLDKVSTLALEATAQNIITAVAALLARPATDVSALALESTAQAAKASADLAASRGATLLARPSAPTADDVAGAVWAAPAAGLLALESTAGAIAGGVGTLLARPEVDVSGLALETTAQAGKLAALAAADDTAALVARPPTDLSQLALETTAQAAASNAALAAALSA